MPLQIISISPRKTKLYLPSKPLTLHQLHRNLSLIACLVDGATMEELIINSKAGKKQERNTGHTSVSENSFVKIAILVWLIYQSQEILGTTLHCKVYSKLQSRNCSDFSKILTIIGRHHIYITILALLSGHKCQSTNSVTLAHYINININRVIFYILKVFKNTARSFHAKSIELKTYNKENVNTSHSCLIHQSNKKKIENPKIL